ncbi:MAG: DUF1800 domain-containing protein [Burkholderiaceae bacterium]
MNAFAKSSRRALVAAVALLASGCSAVSAQPASPPARWAAAAASPASAAAMPSMAPPHAPDSALPAAAQDQIDAMRITRVPMLDLVREMNQQRKAANDLPNDGDAKQAARKAYQQAMNQLEQEAATRHLLRALYSPNRLQEQMTWFWLNHFSVHGRKADLRAMVGDYEDSALRPHALGRFRDLLGAVAHHPAMLRYLDNAQNAANKINENYARELMELHTLGVDAGYSQRDVQELARVLTGVGIARDGAEPKLPPNLRPYYVQHGLFAFDPRRHDFGAKQFLGEAIRAQGLAELDEALDRLARRPATARFISKKLAVWWLADEPPESLVDRMAQTFRHTDGDIAQVLQTMFGAPEYHASAGNKFKDPMRYVTSALQLMQGDSVIVNMTPVLSALNRMGEPLYGRQTPDGYPIDGASWASAGQMATRFEIAKAIGTGQMPLFDAQGTPPQDRHHVVPNIDDARFQREIAPKLSAATRAALAQAKGPQEWNTFLLSSPEFMKQ